MEKKEIGVEERTVDTELRTFHSIWLSPRNMFPIH